MGLIIDKRAYRSVYRKEDHVNTRTFRIASDIDRRNTGPKQSGRNDFTCSVIEEEYSGRKRKRQ